MYEDENAVIEYWKMQSYLEQLMPARPAQLAEMEAYAQEHDFPIIGPLSGQLCYLVARLMGATRIFELGSGFGYSTAWFAQAVRDNLRDSNGDAANAVVHHTVWDDDLSTQARAYMAAMGYAELVRFHTSEAVAALAETPGLFDIIFMDIDKKGYPGAMGEITRKLRQGGVLIVDNMLWDGRLWDLENEEPETVAIRTLAHMVYKSAAWTPMIVPVRDGVLVARYNG
jgi:predicted O-methyltransferase YrrM